MKIAVDAREIVGHPTGVGRYLSELLVEWSQSADARKHQWILYAPRPVDVPSGFVADVRVIPSPPGTMWEQWHLSRALKMDPPDVLFAPGYTAPLRVPCPVALTIHDVSFAAHPEWFGFREGARRRTLTKLSAGRARVVLTDSEFSGREIVRHLDVPRTKVRVIPLGIRRPAPGPAANSRKREPLVLFVGSIFQRRHVDMLIRAFTGYVVANVAASRLEIVGENRAFPPIDLEALIAQQTREAQQRIAVRSYVDEQTLSDLYAQASLFAFPSEYEGFGLTPLEAMAAGVPPVVLETPVASEVYGPAAVYVAPAENLDRRFGEAMAHLLSDDVARTELLRHAPAVLDRYRWERTAALTLEAIEEAARG